VAVVLVQFLSKKKGMTACSYHVPKYFLMSTYGTVTGGVGGTVAIVNATNAGMIASRAITIANLFIF
jgi:hypothetical protein